MAGKDCTYRGHVGVYKLQRPRNMQWEVSSRRGVTYLSARLKGSELYAIFVCNALWRCEVDNFYEVKAGWASCRSLA